MTKQSIDIKGHTKLIVDCRSEEPWSIPGEYRVNTHHFLVSQWHIYEAFSSSCTCDLILYTLLASCQKTPPFFKAVSSTLKTYTYNIMTHEHWLNRNGRSYSGLLLVPCNQKFSVFGMILLEADTRREYRGWISSPSDLRYLKYFKFYLNY